LEADIVFNSASMSQTMKVYIHISATAFTYARHLTNGIAYAASHTSVMKLSGVRPELHPTFAMTHKPIWNILALAEDALGA
jgi:hypothetical protein